MTSIMKKFLKAIYKKLQDTNRTEFISTINMDRLIVSRRTPPPRPTQLPTRQLQSPLSPPTLYLTRQRQVLPPPPKYTSSKTYMHTIFQCGNYAMLICIDTGSSLCFISQHAFLQLPREFIYNTTWYPTPQVVANTTRIGESIIEFRLGSTVYKHLFYILVTNTSIIGQNFITKHITCIDYTEHALHFKNSTTLPLLTNALQTKQVVGIVFENRFEYGIIDTGSEKSIISYNTFLNMAAGSNNVDYLPKDISFMRNVDVVGTVIYLVKIKFNIGKQTFKHLFYIVDIQKSYIILGMDFLRAYTRQYDVVYNTLLLVNDKTLQCITF